LHWRLNCVQTDGEDAGIPNTGCWGEAYNDGVRIFLAGGSGVIGLRLIPRLVQAGHVVGGLTRSLSKTELLNHLGAEPILCDVFDQEVLMRAVRDFKADSCCTN
jgi:nucleoside-diphosphate-sugar epimerase